jgi:hypothetical protein
MSGASNIPLLVEEGWMRVKKIVETHPSTAQSGWSTTKYLSIRDHPVRSFKGGFAPFYLMSRPPLLVEEGNVPTGYIARNLYRWGQPAF